MPSVTAYSIGSSPSLIDRYHIDSKSRYVAARLHNVNLHGHSDFHMTSSTSPTPPATHGAARTADAVMLAGLGASAAAALAIAVSFDQLALGLVGAAALLSSSVAVFLALRGTLASRLLLALCQSAMVALHIQLGRGTLEFHFGVFVTLALLLVYADWRPILAAALFFAVHHVVFDRLQAAGLGTYCISAPDFLKVLIHASYVVIQTSLEMFMALKMGSAAHQGEELEDLVKAADTDAGVCLDLSNVPARSKPGLGLKRIISRMHVAMGEVQSSVRNIQVVVGDNYLGRLTTTILAG